MRIHKPGDHLPIVDTFPRAGEGAWIRRLLNHVVRQIATRTDVVFEHLPAQQQTLQLLRDQSLNPTGWFHFIHLQKYLLAGIINTIVIK